MSLTNNTNELTNINSKISAIKNEYISQTNLISQIKEVLQEKASGELPENKLASLVDGSLTEITASDLQGATGIKAYSFYMRQDLISVDIPSSVEYIGGNAFSSCSVLKTVVIGENVTSIYGNGFYQCRQLENVTILSNSKLESIGSYAFQDCEKLLNITIPNTVTSIGSCAFKSCKSFTNIIIPNTITTIENQVFMWCTNLTNLTIPASVTDIGTGALNIGSTSNLATITMLSTTPPTIASATFNASNLQNIIVPKGYGDTYKNSTNWSSFADYIIESET